MNKMSAKAQRWLKCFHMFAGCVWIGSQVGLVTVLFTLSADDGRELYGILATVDFIDLYVLVPGAIGTLITGLIYSIWTNWGWFKHHWITVKWIICVGGIVFGTFWLGPWLSGTARIANEKGLEALTDATFIHFLQMNRIFGALQMITVIFAAFISVLKPWKRKGLSK